MNTGKIKQILVVGGGSAGWITAALLNQELRQFGCQVTVLESDSIGTIGVGEATIPKFLQLLEMLEIDEKNFLVRCNATYKLGIRFEDWQTSGGYWHGFGQCGATINHRDLYYYWLRAVRETGLTQEYTDFSLQCLLCEAGKAPGYPGSENPVMQNGEYAFHLDAAALVSMLTGLCLGRGVRQVVGDVAGVNRDAEGFLTSLVTAGGETLEADLFFDCTGFNSELIEKQLGVPWRDWGHWLPVNRAIVSRISTNEDSPPFTRCTGLNAGWKWEIPLAHSTGTGYVYAGDLLTADEAAMELCHSLEVSDQELFQPRELSFKVGRREKFWEKNCISVGLSAGFLEPLESTGIALIQYAVEEVINLLPDRGCHPLLVERYNREMSHLYDEVRDFLLLHYLVSDKVETEFWRRFQSTPLPDSLESLLSDFDELGLMDCSTTRIFGETNYFSILAGGQRTPRQLLPLVGYFPLEQIQDTLTKILSQAKRYVSAAPLNRELNLALRQPLTK